MSDRDPAHKAASKTSTKQLGIRLPASLNDRLVAIARSESNNVSSVVRRLLTAALKGCA
jgi:predicted DNA-binding protein